MSAFLRTKRVAWTLALAFATLVLTFSYVSGRRYLNALDWVAHTQSVSSTLERLLSGLRDRESRVRGYWISGDRVLLGDLAREDQALLRDLSMLRGLVADNAAQSRRAFELDALARQRLAMLDELVRESERMPANGPEARLRVGRGSRVMERVVEVEGAMRAEEARLLAQRRDAATVTQQQTIVAVFTLTAALVTLLGAAFLGMQRRATELRQTATELAEAEERLRVLVENVSDLIALHGPDGELLYVSPSVQPLLGYGVEESRTLSPLALLHPEDLGMARYNVQKFQSGEAQSGVVTCRLRRLDGEYRWFEFKLTRVDERGGGLRHIQSAGRDVTVRRQLEQRLAEQAEELRHLSLRDGLTGLYNRRGFLELSQQLVRGAERERHRLALLFADLDGLKDVNDRLGHGHGDRAIVEAAELLRSTCRATDLVARLGGDEYVVLASKVDDDSIEILKQRIGRALEQANAAPGREYRLSLSLGVAMFDPDAPVPIEALLIDADARMYAAKAERRRPRSSPSAAVSSVAYPA